MVSYYSNRPVILFTRTLSSWIQNSTTASSFRLLALRMSSSFRKRGKELIKVINAGSYSIRPCGATDNASTTNQEFPGSNPGRVVAFSQNYSNLFWIIFPHSYFFLKLPFQPAVQYEEIRPIGFLLYSQVPSTFDPPFHKSSHLQLAIAGRK